MLSPWPRLCEQRHINININRQISVYQNNNNHISSNNACRGFVYKNLLQKRAPGPTVITNWREQKKSVRVLGETEELTWLVFEQFYL